MKTKIYTDAELIDIAKSQVTDNNRDCTVIYEDVLYQLIKRIEEYANQSRAASVLLTHFYYGWMAHIHCHDVTLKHFTHLLSKGESEAFHAGLIACSNRWDDFDRGHMTFYNSELEHWKENLSLPLNP